MKNYICKVASREELLKRWDYLVKIHPNNNSWVVFKNNTIKNFDDGNIIVYYGLLDDTIISEITAYINKEAFIGDIKDSTDLYSNNMAYLAAFRTNKEYEGKGYFSKLYNFAENDLSSRGYTELSLGVEPVKVRKILIYFHLGYTEYIKTTIEHDPPKNEFDKPIDEYVNFYKKVIKK